VTQQHFVRRREALWNRFEGIVNGGNKALRAQAAWFPRGFRELTQDLNIARANGYDPSIIERLNRLVLEGNQLLYGQRSLSLRAPLNFIFRVFPQAVRSQWRGLGAVHLLFYGLLFFTALLCVRFPEAVYDLFPPYQLHALEEMYDPQSEYFLTPREISSDADMFGFYIYNNVSIAFKTFAGGILAGFGSLMILAFNAVFIGAAAAHCINSGFAETFFSFTSGHSAFELTGIVFSAQAGLLLGYRFFVTKGLTREASVRSAAAAALPIITGSALLLLIAAVIEGFWSSRHEIDPAIHYGSGAAGALLLAAYFIFAGRKRR
jgi:uncharacterized membrane protein SpoIIM required for sporulation